MIRCFKRTLRQIWKIYNILTETWMAAPAQILRVGNGNTLSRETTTCPALCWQGAVIRGRALQKLDKFLLKQNNHEHGMAKFERGAQFCNQSLTLLDKIGKENQNEN